ncbi:inner membrane protein [Haemophilus influenzae]|uniref:Probable membrane transporter protein n=1 Tax=Haemophilus influenzae TaxID=727 RepID=A0A2X1RNX3_HAEIF|nr:inner membrane protein [Haemophilus influenzae]
MTGMPPAMALGTNKLQAMGGALSASLYFLRKRAVNLRDIWFILIWVFLGSALGTLLIQSIDVAIFKKMLPFLILAIGLYFFIYP